MAKRKSRTTAVFAGVLNTAGHYAAPPGRSVLNRRPTTTRMEALLHAAGLTGQQHNIWVGGWSLKEYLAANPKLTERTWWDMVCENLELFRDPPPLVLQKDLS